MTMPNVSSARNSQSAATPSFFAELIESLAAKGRAIVMARPRNEGQVSVANGDLETVAQTLLSRRGEASGVALAAALVTGYRDASPAERTKFLEVLRDKFGPDEVRTVNALAAAAGNASVLASLHAEFEPLRQELFRRLNFAPGGTRTLISMRQDLLELIDKHPRLRDVDADMLHILSSWFNRGFLALQPLDWTTPAHILEKIIRYEAVHRIDGWDDLKNRLKPADRRCYGFFHPQLVDEPIIFVEVALTRDVPDSIGHLLDIGRQPIAASAAKYATFYSISNTQKGLRGVNFGNFLIKQVVENLKSELSHLEGFVTLSPVPAFAGWLASVRKSARPAAEDERILAQLDQPDWVDDEQKVSLVRPVLMRYAVEFLLNAKGKSGRPIDPVSRFHLGNGAQLDRVCFLGDRSPNGLQQSHGLMVNYRYKLEHIERNHEAFAEHGTVVMADGLGTNTERSKVSTFW